MFFNHQKKYFNHQKEYNNVNLHYRNSMRGLSNPRMNLNDYPAGSIYYTHNGESGVLQPDGVFIVLTEQGGYNRVYIGTDVYNRAKSDSSNNSANNSTNPCPCTNCRTEKVYETRYLSKDKKRADDIQVKVKRKMIICQDTSKVQIECEDELAQLKKSRGLTGLSSCSRYDSRM